jgi:hypothetical protein
MVNLARLIKNTGYEKMSAVLISGGLRKATANPTLESKTCMREYHQPSLPEFLYLQHVIGVVALSD